MWWSNTKKKGMSVVSEEHHGAAESEHPFVQFIYDTKSADN